VVLVQNGILKNFLMSRWPLKGFSHSNGHGRSSSGLRPLGRMANLMIEVKNPLTPAALKNKLVKLLRSEDKPYGFMLVGAYGGDNPSDRSQAQTLQLRPRLVYRVSAKSGKETLVRGVKIVVTPLVVLNRILAASNDETLSNPYFCGAESGWVPVDQIAPSVLVSEVELERLPENRLRPPILPSPLSKKK
jgi:predicted Zn-dependent protease